jgi:putative ABC transport system permease protein
MFSDLLYRLRALFHRKTMEVELDGELRDHLDRQAEKYRSFGLPPKEAMRRARIANKAATVEARASSKT